MKSEENNKNNTVRVNKDISQHKDILNQLNEEGLDLLKSVPVTLSVELGRVTRSIRNVLSLTEGSTLVLDKSSKEPLNVLVNGIVIARGEVIEEKGCFGIRITDLVDNNNNHKA